MALTQGTKRKVCYYYDGEGLRGTGGVSPGREGWEWSWGGGWGGWLRGHRGWGRRCWEGCGAGVGSVMGDAGGW